MDDEKIIKEKTLQIEEMISGLWMDLKNDEIWSFFKIQEDERVGDLIIAGTGRPTPGRFMRYEIIWVNDDKVFIDLIWLSIAFRTQQQIWITDKSLKIKFIGKSNQDFYIDLVKV
jgi:hypothetical protein